MKAMFSPGNIHPKLKIKWLHLSIRMQNFFKVEMTLHLNNQLLTSFTLLHFPNTNYKNKQKLAEPQFLFRGVKIKL
jgi:hypothetical protein